VTASPGEFSPPSSALGPKAELSDPAPMLITKTRLGEQIPVIENSSPSRKTWNEIRDTPAVFSVRQRYFGHVNKVHTDYFSVQLSDEHSGEYADAEIPKTMIPPEDHSLLVEGVEFVWVLGYEARTSIRHSEILYIPKFRRVSDESLASSRTEIDSLMDGVFGPIDANPPVASSE
jgi:hypothetical protein